MTIQWTEVVNQHGLEGSVASAPGDPWENREGNAGIAVLGCPDKSSHLTGTPWAEQSPAM